VTTSTELLATLESVRRGDTPIVALDPAMYKPWTADEKRRFEQAIRIVCGELSSAASSAERRNED
jgi:hypothetical protein